MIRFCRFHNTSEGKVNRNSVTNKTYIAFSFMLSHLVLFNPQARAVTPGFTLGEFSVTQQGASSYSVPLSVSPGTAGMQPALSFNYNSNSGNSAMGLGWNLSGLSQITRCPATIAQDSFYDPVDYDDNDRFCLDGQRLQLVSGDYGADGAEYRTELDSQAKIISYDLNSNNNGPEYFRVFTKAGQVFEYGFTLDARIQAQRSSDIRMWPVNKYTDSMGNYVLVRYHQEPGAGESYPVSIS